MDLTTPQWEHDPTRTPANATPDETAARLEGEMTWAELHQASPRGGRCFGCWCYSCGGRTDQPRVIRDAESDAEHRAAQDAPTQAAYHANPGSHRWCFE